MALATQKKVTKKVAKKFKTRLSKKSGTPKVSIARVKTLLDLLGACYEAKQFASRQKTGGDVWSKCTEFGWMNWILGRVGIRVDPAVLKKTVWDSLGKDAKTKKEKAFWSAMRNPQVRLTKEMVPPGKTYAAFHQVTRCTGCWTRAQNADTFENKIRALLAHDDEGLSQEQAKALRKIVKKKDVMNAVIRECRTRGI